MHKKIVLFVLIFFLWASGSAFSDGVGNCVAPLQTTTDHLGVGGGLGYNYVERRGNHLLNSSSFADDSKIEHINQLYGKFNVGVFENFNLYAKIGGCNYDLSFTDQSLHNFWEIKTENGVYTGGGINMLFPVYSWKFITLGLGGDFQGNFSHNGIKEIDVDGRSARSISGSLYSVSGQNSAYFTCKLETEKYRSAVIGYLGGFHSWMLLGTAKHMSYDTSSTGFVEQGDIRAVYDFTSFGLLVGMDIDVYKYANVNIEGRFIGETAFTTGVTVKF